jgi:hypothetical protein
MKNIGGIVGLYPTRTQWSSKRRLRLQTHRKNCMNKGGTRSCLFLSDRHGFWLHNQSYVI